MSNTYLISSLCGGKNTDGIPLLQSPIVQKFSFNKCGETFWAWFEIAECWENTFGQPQYESFYISGLLPPPKPSPLQQGLSFLGMFLTCGDTEAMDRSQGQGLWGKWLALVASWGFSDREGWNNCLPPAPLLVPAPKSLQGCSPIFFHLLLISTYLVGNMAFHLSSHEWIFCSYIAFLYVTQVL